MIGAFDSILAAPKTSCDSLNQIPKSCSGSNHCFLVFFMFLSPRLEELWPVEIRDVGESFLRISFWDSLITN